jgi:raffinose/stachyose/melibiose transport system substrate-binding protein
MSSKSRASAEEMRHRRSSSVLSLLRLLALISAAIALIAVAGCGSDDSSGSGAASKEDKYSGNIDFWFYGEDDNPGINRWMEGRIAEYERLHPDVSIKLSPQDGKTLAGKFNLAARSRSGPDIASQFSGAQFISAVANGHVTPIADLVPADEIANWLDPDRLDGKVQGMPLTINGIQFVWNKKLFRKAGLDPEQLPATFDEFLTACHKLNDAGITPIASSNTNGIFGTWIFGIFGRQKLDSVSDFGKLLTGEEQFSSAPIAEWYTAFKQMLDEGCFNDDVSSVSYEQVVQQFAQGKTAMIASTDGGVVEQAKYIGAENTGVGSPPRWGDAALADSANAGAGTQYFVTSWSDDKAAAAAFLAWLHAPENLTSLNKAILALPADERFDVESVTDPLAKRVYETMRSGPPVSVSLLIPPYVDANANIVASQMITSKSGSPEEAAKTWDTAIENWRTRNPGEYQVYKQWLAEQQ